MIKKCLVWMVLWLFSGAVWAQNEAHDWNLLAIYKIYRQNRPHLMFYIENNSSLMKENVCITFLGTDDKGKVLAKMTGILKQGKKIWPKEIVIGSFPLFKFKSHHDYTYLKYYIFSKK